MHSFGTKQLKKIKGSSNSDSNSNKDVVAVGCTY